MSVSSTQCGVFQSTLPVRGATGAAPLQPGRADISIHAPRAGSDQHIGGLFVQDTDFNPCSPCGERPWVVWAVNSQQLISIHAPRAGSDLSVVYFYGMLDDFNPRSPCGERRQRSYSSLAPRLISIHAPRAGSDVRLYRDDGGKVTFQSTLPVRGATRLRQILWRHR